MTTEATYNADSDYEQAHAAVAALRLSDGALWALACDRGADFWARQGAYIELTERRYAMPVMLPYEGDAMPVRGRPALTLVRNTP